MHFQTPVSLVAAICYSIDIVKGHCTLLRLYGRSREVVCSIAWANSTHELPETALDASNDLFRLAQ